MSKSVCGRKAEKPASRAAVQLGRGQLFPLGSGNTGMQGGRGAFTACFVYQEQKSDAL